MMIKCSSFYVLLLSSLISGSIYAQNERKLSQLDSLFNNAHRIGVFNGNVLVAEKGAILYKKTIGWADASEKIKLTEDDRFMVGSIAKEFNAVGIMMLEESGRLRLEDKISKYLPELPSWSNSITIQHLLQYSSGIPQSNWKEIKGDADNMKFLNGVKTLSFNPGTKYDYNNNDVFLQRRIIEKITGLSYPSFISEKIFKPCGIEKAIFDPGERDSSIARSYDDNKVQDNLRFEFGGWPALNLQDFYKWCECINSFKLINPGSTKELVRPFSTDNQTGLGHGSVEAETLTFHRHDGTAKNYQALLISDSKTARIIILMTNNKQDNLDAISKSVQSILDGKPYLAIKRSFVHDFDKRIKDMTGQDVLALYQKTKLEQPQQYNFGSETTLNQVGYLLLNDKKIQDAIFIFTFNTTLFPTSGNLFDSLGEAYYIQGDRVKALENYKIALRLDPGLESAKKMIQELK